MVRPMKFVINFIVPFIKLIYFRMERDELSLRFDVKISQCGNVEPRLIRN